MLKNMSYYQCWKRLCCWIFLCKLWYFIYNIYTLSPCSSFSLYFFLHPHSICTNLKTMLNKSTVSLSHSPQGHRHTHFLFLFCPHSTRRKPWTNQTCQTGLGGAEILSPAHLKSIALPSCSRSLPCITLSDGQEWRKIKHVQGSLFIHQLNLL